MSLSYTLRLLCLLAVVGGMVTAALQILLALNARALLRRLDAAAARRRERILCLAQIAPWFVALLIAGALCLPEYLRYEPNRESEPVGWLCLLLAAAVGLWFGSALLRGLRITFRTLRFARACRRSGRIVQDTSRSTPILALEHAGHPIGLLGFFRPFVLISAEWLEAGDLKAGALEVAIDHERSHAAHGDNWKLLALSFLPRLHRRFPGGDRLRQQWQMAVDWAADDDASRGDSSRSILLAEALVCAARAAGSRAASRAPVICSALTSAEAGLAVRVDRLLHPRLAATSAGAPLPLGLAVLALLAALAAALASPAVYSLSEHLLHLGGY
ncbi:MAG TPA: hypothetical protein VHX37_08755 [Acidobacteriaceae bacterium]|jgi:beta-lactamase regulating signal transducer with metallopeptidase domain|nr:hypothetical protein [Acidobacteriaceae bacterium]